MERLKEVLSDDSEAMYLGKPDHNGDFKWYPVVTLTYMDYHEDNPDYKYHVDVAVVSPEAAGKDGIDKAFACCGMEDQDVIANEENQVIALREYGIYTLISSWNFNSKNAALKEARRDIAKLRMLFGFYMDRPVNMIGTSGWDAVKGDILAGLNYQR